MFRESSAPSTGVFKTSTAATGTCVIVAGKSSLLLIRAGTAHTEDNLQKSAHKLSKIITECGFILKF